MKWQLHRLWLWCAFTRRVSVRRRGIAWLDTNCDARPSSVYDEWLRGNRVVAGGSFPPMTEL